jgi:hypothetical protein
MTTATRRQFVAHVGEGALAVSASLPLAEWLRRQPRPPELQINDIGSLRRALQLAMMLEHSTIPPYLTALFSIEPGHNVEVAGLIRSVVVEEMFHMALAGNILNAIGGRPMIDRSGFVPSYPGRLPGGVRPDLTVHLRACSKKHIADCFMAIEEPTDVVVPRGIPVPSPHDVAAIEIDDRDRISPLGHEVAQQLEQHFQHATHVPLTIGFFYQQVAQALIRLSDNGRKDIFTGNPAFQIRSRDYPGAPGTLYAVAGSPRDKLHASLLAINEIERQGEGSGHTDPTDGQDELGHYYRFQEIVEGRQMVQHGPGDWRFTGKEIPFDPARVMPMVDDPSTAALTRHTAVWRRARGFDRAYGNLLRALHGMFNGNPKGLAASVALMFRCEAAAADLLAMPIRRGSDWRAGPSFQPDLSRTR